MKDRTKLEAICDIAMSLIPVAGAVYHGRKNHKEGFLDASALYEPKLRKLVEQNRQMRRDVFGEEQVFICPEAWDADFRMKKMEVFVKEHTGTDVSTRELLVAFLEFCIETFPQKRLAQTLDDMKIVHRVLSATSKEASDLSQDDVELAIDFLSFYKESKELKQLKKELNGMYLPNTNGCNFLVLGKTGVGKSSLLNCLLGGERFKTGTGKPVTGKGIYESEGELDGIKVRVFDSWGLEAGAVEEWHRIIKDAQEKHDVSHKIEDWFHAVVYCINSGSHRVEDVDNDMIRSLLQDDLYVVVALTQADLCSEKDAEIMRETLCSKDQCEKLLPENVIETCVGGETRGGKTEPFGISELKRAILTNYKRTIVAQVPLRCIHLARQEVEKFRKSTNVWISGCEWKYDENENIAPLRKKCDVFVKTLLREQFPKIIKGELEACAKYARNLAAVLQFDEVDDIIPPTLPEQSFWDSVCNFISKTFDWLNPFAESNAVAEQRRLSDKLDRCCDSVISQIEKQQSAIAKKVKEVLS